MNFEKFQTETPVTVYKTTLTVVDRRSGACADKVFYRPSAHFPQDVIARELNRYGYDVLGYSEDEEVQGVINWEEVFSGFKALTTIEAA